jgi:hypothetical protein
MLNSALAANFRSSGRAMDKVLRRAPSAQALDRCNGTPTNISLSGD